MSYNLFINMSYKDEKPIIQKDDFTGPDFMNIKLVNQQDDSKMSYTVHKQMSMSVLRKTYAEHINVLVDTLVLKFKGQRIGDNETPKMLEMKENSVMEAFIEQEKPVSKLEKDESDGEHIKIRVNGAGNEVIFRVKPTIAMENIFKMYCNSRGVELNTIRFCIYGRRIKNNETPKSLNLEDGDEIDAFLPQEGGNRKN